MGSDILSSDMILNTYLNPSTWAFVHGQYDKACLLLFMMNSFFTKFDEGIDDMPFPREPHTDINSRVHPDTYYLNYYGSYAPLMSGLLGKYQRTKIEGIKEDTRH